MSTGIDGTVPTIQRLRTLEAVECEACGERVYFHFRSSEASADPRYRVVYLRCPLCGHSATQLQEIPSRKASRKAARTRYRYKP